MRGFQFMVNHYNMNPGDGMVGQHFLIFMINSRQPIRGEEVIITILAHFKPGQRTNAGFYRTTI
jgi:hypothetical protein